MNALEIISEIELLPPEEQVKVVRFTQRLTNQHKLSGADLSLLAAQLPDASPSQEARIREEIEAGFYGSKSRA